MSVGAISYSGGAEAKVPFLVIPSVSILYAC